MNKKLTSVLALAMSLTMVTGFVAGCSEEPPVTPAVFKQAEYNTTTSVMPSNWNELTYADNNDTQIMSYIGSSFFDYDFKFENDKKYLADGSINKEGIVVGAYTTNYSAATKIEDVTSTVASKWGYTAAQKTEGGYAWKITLRNDLKWDDGTAIDAGDFVYSMQAQLDPAFMNMRANTYYDTLRIKRSRAYFYKNQEATYPIIGSFDYETNADAVAAEEDIHIDMYGVGMDLLGLNLRSLVDAEGNKMPQYLPYDDLTVYDLPEVWAMPDGDEKDAAAYNLTASFFWENIGPGAPYSQYCEVGASYESWLGIKVENNDRDVDFEDVGIYEVEGENAFVICLDKAYKFLKDDGELSYLAAYYMSSLPLVKESLYEECKQEPAAGATLWTSNYNTSLETSASWGPYKLAEFEAGSHYKLVKNDNWFGYNMEQYKNQYNVTAINCRKVSEFSTQWMGFLNGTYDDASLASENIEDYRNSKYVTYAPSTGTFGMQLFSDLKVLKNSGKNNGILAIDEFRQALSLSLNRSDVVETIFPGTSTPCLGLVNSEYYYDIENSADLADKGVYRNTIEAKEGLLRAYGFTKGNDGKWSTGELTGLTLEEAYYSLTGYNPTVAKQRMVAAITELTENAEYYGYDPSKPITLVYGSSVDTPKQRDRAAYLQNIINGLTKDTDLEGKIVIEFDASAGDGWADAFRNGDTQIGFGYGFTGNPFNPFDIIGAFVDPDDSLNYHTYWDTSAVDMTLTMPAGDYAGAGETITMSLQNWFFCLNGLGAEKGQEFTYNWDAGYAPANVRLTILAALEEQVLKKSLSVMLVGDYSGSFLSPKFDNFTDDYNTFMGFGGIRYMVVNYTDAEWAAFVAANNNDLTNEYKKTE